LARREVEQSVTITLLPKKLAAAGMVSALVKLTRREIVGPYYGSKDKLFVAN